VLLRGRTWEENVENIAFSAVSSPWQGTLSQRPRHPQAAISGRSMHRGGTPSRALRAQCSRTFRRPNAHVGGATGGLPRRVEFLTRAHRTCYRHGTACRATGPAFGRQVETRSVWAPCHGATRCTDPVIARKGKRLRPSRTMVSPVRERRRIHPLVGEKTEKRSPWHV
jgi:hypothetical protein